LAKWEAALEMNPVRGQHMLYSNMAVAHLQLGHKEESLHMAQKAVALAPNGFHVVGVGRDGGMGDKQKQPNEVERSTGCHCDALGVSHVDE
jgi:hypothetical protein